MMLLVYAPPLLQQTKEPFSPHVFYYSCEECIQMSDIGEKCPSEIPKEKSDIFKSILCPINLKDIQLTIIED